ERSVGRTRSCRQDRFGRRWSIAERGVRPYGIVMQSPSLDEHLRFVERRELLRREDLVAQLRIEALAVAVLPGTAWLDEERLHADAAEPATHIAGYKFGPVV